MVDATRSSGGPWRGCKIVFKIEQPLGLIALILSVEGDDVWRIWHWEVLGRRWRGGLSEVLEVLADWVDPHF